MTLHWEPSAPPERLRLRARLLQTIRDVCRERGVLEVPSPSMSHYTATDPYTHSFSLATAQDTAPLFLQTSPEGFLKQYMGAYPQQDVFYVGPVFRHDTPSITHLPEFTMLEYYRHNYTWRALAEEVVALIDTLYAAVKSTSMWSLLPRVDHVRWCAYAELVAKWVIPHVPAAQKEAFEQTGDYAAIDWYHAYHAAHRPSVKGIDATDQALWQQLCWTEIIEPRCRAYPLMVVFDYPAEQRIFAQLAPAAMHPTSQLVAQRFEIYAYGVEIANGWREEQDPSTLLAIMEKDRMQRTQLGHQAIPVDKRIIAWSQKSSAPISGVAIGIERLFASLVGDSIHDWSAFSATL